MSINKSGLFFKLAFNDDDHFVKYREERLEKAARAEEAGFCPPPPHSHTPLERALYLDSVTIKCFGSLLVSSCPTGGGGVFQNSSYYNDIIILYVQ